MLFRKKPNRIPDPGQRVRLLGRRGPSLQGRYRTISGTFTAPKGGAVIRVAEEREYRVALEEDRNAESIPWPAQQTEVVSPPRRSLRQT